MEYRYLGQTGMKVSAACLGCMTFEPGGADEPTARRMLDAFVAAGGNFLDMADNYPGVEPLIGRWLKGRTDRDQLVIGTKTRFPAPPNGPNDVGLTAKHLRSGVDRTLAMLGVDYIDVYQAHCWDFVTPIDETVRVFGTLIDAGKIRYWGVSNFDGSDVEELARLPGGGAVATNQVLYNLTRRGIEYDLLPSCTARGIPIMAYSPIEQGRMLGRAKLNAVAARHGVSAAQVAIAWVLRKDGVFTIPKAATPAHVRENRAALDLRLTEEDYAELDGAFPPPQEPRPLELL